MAIQISTAARAAAVDAVVDLLDAGTGNPYIQIRTGSAGSIDSAATGTLLATLNMDGTAAFGAATSADPSVATAATISDDTAADADGTAGHFVAYDRDDAAIFNGSVTATGGGGDLTLNTTTIATGGTVSITSFTFSLPKQQS